MRIPTLCGPWILAMVGLMKSRLILVAVGAVVAAVTMVMPVRAEEAPSKPSAYDPSVHKTADDLWIFIQANIGKLQVQFKSMEEAMAVGRQVMPIVDDALADFATRFPKDERFSESVLMRTQIWSFMGQIDLKPFDIAKADALLQQVIDSPTTLKTDKADARFAMIQFRLEQLKEDGPKEAFKGVNEKIESFLKDYPNDRRIDMVLMVQAKVLGNLDPERQLALLKKLSESPNVRVAMAAQQELTAMQLKKEPLDLKFVDMNGKQVDLAKMRGKVVLIDFWATWCKPCLDDLPNVIPANEKYKDKGLLILGVSWDNEKDQLEAFLKEKSMTWPQYFEGNGNGGGQDKISRRFGIMGIPTQWLVDKKGFVRDMDARGNLDAQIAKLLAE
jgi:thiol-disulfide isomerase/thioredoxin